MSKWAAGSGAFYSPVELRWSLPAAEDLERICTWIERDNPEAARRVAKIIYDGCDQLKEFPHMGRPSRRIADGVNWYFRRCRILPLSGEGKRG
jgi:plasmid stabilization system protein ParE